MSNVSDIELIKTDSSKEGKVWRAGRGGEVVGVAEVVVVVVVVVFLFCLGE